MALPLYLAMTAAEFRDVSHIGAMTAWMSCHFSPGGDGLSNLPPFLPEGSMVIVDDWSSFQDHSPGVIARQLHQIVTERSCSCVLLDLQRPKDDGYAPLIQAVLDTLTCPVGLSAPFAREYSCPVLLPPVPPDTPPEHWFAPWEGRELWLEAALDGIKYTVTASGSQSAPIIREDIPLSGHASQSLYCHYTTEVLEDAAFFRLYRTKEDLQRLLQAVEGMGVTRAVGLWQELG